MAAIGIIVVIKAPSNIPAPSMFFASAGHHGLSTAEYRNIRKPAAWVDISSSDSGKDRNTEGGPTFVVAIEPESETVRKVTVEWEAKRQ